MTESNEIYLHSQCHPSSPTWVAYLSGEDAARVECAKCKREIVTLALRETPKEEAA